MSDMWNVLYRATVAATSAAEGVDQSKANNDASADPPKATAGGAPEDSDADPDVDVLAVGPLGLSSGNKEIGQEDYKGADRPWVKNVSMYSIYLIVMKEEFR